ncbi:MAG: OmpA family protein [Hyphomicrobiaceae bacterium]
MNRDMITVECRRLATALSSSSLLALVAAAALLPESPAFAAQPLAVLPTTSVSDLVKMREAWGTAPSAVVATAAADSFAVLPTTTVDDLVKMREGWGSGKPAAPVSAPLAAGSVLPLPQDGVALPAGPKGDPVVHAFTPTPVATLTPVAAGDIEKSLKALLSTRESWGSAPSTGAVPVSAAAASSGYAVLPTNALTDLLAMREAWGAAPATKVAMAAVVPSQAGGASSGFAVLPTSNVDELVKMREAWGTGPQPTKIKAPLAAGAVSPLPQVKVAAAAQPTADVIVNPFTPSPVAEVAPIGAGQIEAAMKALLAERESWGTAPSVRTAAATPAPAVATAPDSAKGCEARLREAALAGAILFESNSARLDAKSNATLDAIVTVAKGCGKGRIRIEGHTDSSGRALKNKQLSASRAEAVADYLRKAGVPKNRLVPVGVGQEQPVASNETPEGRAQNRRIEFKVIE